MQSTEGVGQATTVQAETTAADAKASAPIDSFADGLNLARVGSPHYTSDVPALGPTDNKLAMAFANIGLGGPAFPGEYAPIAV